MRLQHSSSDTHNNFNTSVSVELNKNLIKLAGYYSYKRIKQYIKIGNYKYIVVDSIDKRSTGLDAMTVQNVEMGEYTIVFQGAVR